MMALALAAACSPGEGDAPYLEFLGGGFVFNYRLAQAEYGFVVKRLRRIPDGTILEAVLANPGGGEPFVLRETAAWDRLEYVFRSPPVRGVKANHDYRVEVRLIDPVDRRVLATYARAFRSDVDQSVLPERAPVVGPGYQPAPR
ncbi:MAG: hypothetical protein OEO84_04400 [Betaproteobacteria bacterium]|nr:hypothetical protein [Betaproteobacteria bacterium]